MNIILSTGWYCGTYRRITQKFTTKFFEWDSYIISTLVSMSESLHIGHLCTLFGQWKWLRWLGFYRWSRDEWFSHWWLGWHLPGKLIVAFENMGTDRSRKNHRSIISFIYVKITKDVEANPEVDQECRDAFVELSKGILIISRTLERIHELYQYGGWSWRILLKLWNDYHIGESFYQWITEINKELKIYRFSHTMKMIVDELVEKGIVTTQRRWKRGCYIRWMSP